MDENQQGVQLIESEEDKKKKGPATQPGSAFAPAGPSAPSGTQQARAAQAAGSTRGTGFTGVGRFLQANVGSRLGQEVAGRVSQAGQQAASRLGQAAGQFQQQLGSQQRELTRQQQAAQSALQRIAGGGAQRIQPEPIKGTEQVQQNVEQSTSLTPSQEEVAAYQAIAGGQIQAPTGLQDVEDVRAQAGLAGKLAKQTQTTTGRTGLLQQVVGRGPRQYTAGQSALDALILGQSGGQLAAARRASAGLGRQVETQSRLAEEQARQFGTRATEAGRTLESARESELSRISELAKSQKNLFEKEQSDFYNTALKEIESGVLSPETAIRLFGSVGDVDLAGLSKKDALALVQKSIIPTFESSLSQKQAATINALKMIKGENPQFTEKQLADIIGKTADVPGIIDSRGVSFDPEGKIKARTEEFYKQKRILDDVIDWAYKSGQGGLAERLRSVSYGDVDIPQFGGSWMTQRGHNLKNPLGAEQAYQDLIRQLFSEGEIGVKADAALRALKNIKGMNLVGDTLKVAPPKDEEDKKRYSALERVAGSSPLGPKNYS